MTAIAHLVAREHGFESFSPYARPSVIAVAEAIPFAEMTQGSHEKLYAMKGEVVGSGVRQVLGIEMPVNPKRRFQDGAGTGRARVSKAWCRNVFNRLWDERLRDTPDALDRRSGNEVPVIAGR